MTPDVGQTENEGDFADKNWYTDLSATCESVLKLAFEMHNAGRKEPAEALCRLLEPLCPQDAQLLFLTGMMAHKDGRYTEAVEKLSRAAKLDPRSTRILNGLGCAYQRLNDQARAAEAFARSLELEPRSSATCYNYGNTCHQLGRIEQAAELFQQAVQIDPRDYTSWNNLGKCLKELNRLDESIAAYNRSLEVAPEYPLARYGRALALLSAGRLQEGFREYESRRQIIPRRNFPQPIWQGESMPGKTIFLHAEQGFGDAIQSVRFIPAVKERAGRVILECRPELKTLFQYSKCADAVIAYGEPIPPFDSYLSLASLPHVLGVTLENIPNQVPYLFAPSVDHAPVKPAPHLRVGLVWAGNSGHHQDAIRSLRLEDLAPILKVPGVCFQSLQQPIPAGDAAHFSSLADRLPAGPPFADFLATAAAVSELDLIISVDTAVAHLAGALGKPVWCLIQYSPDWRWFLERDDTPWYPSMRLFRQRERNQWQAPILEAAEALCWLVKM